MQEKMTDAEIIGRRLIAGVPLALAGPCMVLRIIIIVMHDVWRVGK